MDLPTVITVMKGGVKGALPIVTKIATKVLERPGGPLGHQGGHTHGCGRPHPLWISDRGTSFEVTTPIFGRGRPRPLFGGYPLIPQFTG